MLTGNAFVHRRSMTMHANFTKKGKGKGDSEGHPGRFFRIDAMRGSTPYAVIASLYRWDRRARICTVERKVTEQTKRHTSISNRRVACLLVTMQSSLRALATVNHAPKMLTWQLQHIQPSNILDEKSYRQGRAAAQTLNEPAISGVRITTSVLCNLAIACSRRSLVTD